MIKESFWLKPSLLISWSCKSHLPAFLITLAFLIVQSDIRGKVRPELWLKKAMVKARKFQSWHCQVRVRSFCPPRIVFYNNCGGPRWVFLNNTNARKAYERIFTKSKTQNICLYRGSPRFTLSITFLGLGNLLHHYCVTRINHSSLNSHLLEHKA